MKTDCFICNKLIPAHDVIYEDPDILAFLDLYPPTKGYTLVAVKKHVESITQLTQSEYMQFQKVIHSVAMAIEKAFQPQRVCLLQIGGFVPHLHFHVIPVYEKITKQVLEKLIFEHAQELPVGERKELVRSIKMHLL